MFGSAAAFKQDLATWNVASVSDMVGGVTSCPVRTIGGVTSGGCSCDNCTPQP
jgi:surface protein